jgi:hypothetical protein
MEYFKPVTGGGLYRCTSHARDTAVLYLVLIIWTKVFIVVEYYSKKRASVIVRTSKYARRIDCENPKKEIRAERDRTTCLMPHAPSRAVLWSICHSCTRMYVWYLCGPGCMKRLVV